MTQHVNLRNQKAALTTRAGTVQLRPILQSYVGECGLCCVRMLAEWIGIDERAISVHVQPNVSVSGVSAAALLDMLGKLGVSAVGVQMSEHVLSPRYLPIIVHWIPHHFVVVEAATDTDVVIVDPARGRVSIPRSDAHRYLGKVALVCRESLSRPTSSQETPAGATRET